MTFFINPMSNMLKTLSTAALLSLVAAPAMAQSYVAGGVTVGDNQTEESVLVRYGFPVTPVSIRGQYTSFETPEVALSATYDSNVGVYVGLGVAADVSDQPGLLTADAEGDVVTFAQIGYERPVGAKGYVGVDYKRSLADDTYAITGFLGVGF